MTHTRTKTFPIIARSALVLSALVMSSGALAETRSTQAIVKPGEQATISVSISARVASIPFRQGDSFKQGEALIAFDCRRFKAEWLAARAVFAAKAQIARDKVRLLKHGAIGRAEVNVAKAEMVEARALAEIRKVGVSQCAIKAPYDGQVVEILINRFETPGANQPLLKIVAAHGNEVEMIVPTIWLRWLKPGTPFKLHVAATKKVLSANIARLGAVVDAVSQTVRVTGRFQQADTKVKPGMSGTARFAIPDS